MFPRTAAESRGLAHEGSFDEVDLYAIRCRSCPIRLTSAWPSPLHSSEGSCGGETHLNSTFPDNHSNPNLIPPFSSS